ncbi:TorF family putative porin [Methylobacterium durans]|uniref:TorF family putative porin n=1 Tax=Methylobacterium durans TaxID=2202825 RepID=UPI002AFFC936|nr:TorF family putative porin [Methylobacterium durans]MEA1835150.1 TorF family putative porin [Methylobacterium durans]
MPRSILKIAAVAAMIGCHAGSAQAADMAAPKVIPPEAKVPDPIIGFAFYSQIASDYNLRGVSQSDRQYSYQSFFEAQFFNNFAYAGFYTWQTRLPTRPDFEFDLVAGIRPTFDKLSFDLGVLYYFYPNEQPLILGGTQYTTRNTDYIEYAGKVLYQATPELAIGANVFFAPNYLGQHTNGTYASGTVAYTLPATWFSFLPEAYAGGFSISGEGGHYFLGAAKTSATGFIPFDLPSYNYGNIGVSWAYKNLLVDLRFHTTDLSPAQCFNLTGDPKGILRGTGRSDWCGDAVIGSIRWQASTTNPGVYAEPGGFLNIFR